MNAILVTNLVPSNYLIKTIVILFSHPFTPAPAGLIRLIVRIGISKKFVVLLEHVQIGFHFEFRKRMARLVEHVSVHKQFVFGVLKAFESIRGSE